MNFRPQVDLIDMQSHADRENKAFLYIKIILQNLCSFNQLHLSVNCLPINYGTYLVYLKLQAHPPPPPSPPPLKKGDDLSFQNFRKREGFRFPHKRNRIGKIGKVVLKKRVITYLHINN